MKNHEPYQQVEGFSGNTMWSSMHSDGQVQWVLSMSAVGNLRESWASRGSKSKSILICNSRVSSQKNDINRSSLRLYAAHPYAVQLDAVPCCALPSMLPLSIFLRRSFLCWPFQEARLSVLVSGKNPWEIPRALKHISEVIYAGKRTPPGRIQIEMSFINKLTEPDIEQWQRCPKWNHSLDLPRIENDIKIGFLKWVAQSESTNHKTIKYVCEAIDKSACSVHPFPHVSPALLVSNMPCTSSEAL